MKNIQYIIILIVASIFTSCDKGSNILIPPDSDTGLQEQLVGVWTSQYNTNSLIYNNNSTFIDSQFAVNPLDSIRYKLVFIAEGNYSIVDSILFESNINIKFIDSSYFSSTGYNFNFSSNYLKFTNNKLTQIPVNVFESTNGGNNNELWGSWSRIMWVYNFRITEPSYLGRVKVVENFDKTSKYAFWWAEYLDRTTNNISDTLWSNNVIYNPPILDMLGTGDYLVKVRFKNNKMYWWEPYEPVLYNRVK